MSRRLTIALVASLLVLALGVAGLAGYMFFKPEATHASPAVPPEPVEKAAEKAAPLAYFKLKNFLTDLADKDRLRYVDVTVALGVTDEAALEETKKLEPQIRDVVLSHLRGMTATDLAGAAGKDKLAGDLTKRLGELLEKQLKQVFVTDLVIQ